ncbi:hypothetical protein VTH06DRAFT_7421 [Thermothelomyces fergusii]
MKLDSILATSVLASTAAAIGPAGPIPRLHGVAEKMKNWKWPDPFSSPKYEEFTVACEATGRFRVSEHPLDDLSVDHAHGGLLAYRDALKAVFASREYPGSWDGIDPHGYDRKILLMDYETMPLRVREWIEDQERKDGPGKGLYAVYPRPAPGVRVMKTINIPDEVPVSDEWRAKDDRRVALFAPGAIYEQLPLWVAEGSECEEQLADLSKYSAELVDGGVVAYPVEHTKPGSLASDRGIEFTIKAQVLKRKEGAPAAEKAEGAEKTEETEKAEDAGESKSTEKEEL